MEKDRMKSGHGSLTWATCQLFVRWSPKKYANHPYSRNFANGTNFRIFRTHTNCAKIGNYEQFCPEMMRLPDSFSHGNVLSITALQMYVPVIMVGTYRRLDGEWKKHALCVERFELAQHLSNGCGLKDMDNSKIRTLKFYSNKNLKLYKNMYQRKFPFLWYHVQEDDHEAKLCPVDTFPESRACLAERRPDCSRISALVGAEHREPNSAFKGGLISCQHYSTCFQNGK